MALESPLIKDGSQTVAAANYWNPASPLYGPNGSGQFLGVYLSASRTVTVQTTSGGIIYGILQNSPAQGQAADVVLYGISKAVAGAAIAALGPVMMDTNGRVIAWTACGARYQVGYTLETAAGANQLITILLYSPNVVAAT